MSNNPSVRVLITGPAASVRDALRGRERTRYDAWLHELRSQGCRVAGYRMTGDVVDRLCVRHLVGNLRAITAFEAPAQVVIIALGPHDVSNPDQDVYTQLYRMAGIDPPVGERTKPACCGGDGLPPEAAELVDTLVASLDELVKSSRRKSRMR